MTNLRYWRHGGFNIVIALVLMGFLPACDRAGNAPAAPPPVHSAKADREGKKTAEAFKARHAIFLYRARPDNRHLYDQPVVEKRLAVQT